MDPLCELWYLFLDWLVDVSAEPGFFSGAVIGAVGVALAAFAVFQVRFWCGKVKAPFKPQTVTHKTDKTPAQVVGSSCSTFVVGVVVIAFVICVLACILYPRAVQEVLRVLGL